MNLPRHENTETDERFLPPYSHIIGAVKLKKKLLFLPPVILGVLVFVLLGRGKKTPERIERPESARPVRVASAEARNIEVEDM